MSKFQVYKDASGKYRFRLRAGNNQIVAVGEAYEQRASCLNGIKSVQKNCKAEIEDLTIGDRSVPNPKFQIHQDAKGKYRFRLRAGNGEIIAEGEGYDSKAGCLHGIEVVRESCDAEIEDSTIPKKKPTTTIASGEEQEAISAPAEAIQNEPVIEKQTEVEVKPVEPEPPKIAELAIPAVKTEEIIKESAPSTVMAEPPEEIPWDTRLVLDSISQPFSKGAFVTFKGKLFSQNSGKGVPDANIKIFERDKSILGDDYLAFGKTEKDGEFAISWRARSLTWRKNSGDIYAVFEGNTQAKPAKSDIQRVTIV